MSELNLSHGKNEKIPGREIRQAESLEIEHE